MEYFDDFDGTSPGLFTITTIDAELIFKKSVLNVNLMNANPVDLANAEKMCNKLLKVYKNIGVDKSIKFMIEISKYLMKIHSACYAWDSFIETVNNVFDIYDFYFKETPYPEIDLMQKTEIESLFEFTTMLHQLAPSLITVPAFEEASQKA
jgi:hypothetical protein